MRDRKKDKCGMDMGYFIIKGVASIRAIGGIIKCMARAHFSMQMVALLIKEIGMMMNFMAEAFFTINHPQWFLNL